MAIETSSTSPYLTWPEVPQVDRPKPLYHNMLSVEDIVILSSKGWLPTDVRLLPGSSDAERSLRVKAYLEGLQMGTIQGSRDLLDILELEAKACGCIGNKVSKDEKPKAIVATDLDALLTLPQSKRSFSGNPEGSKAVEEIAKRDLNPPRRKKKDK